MVTLCRHTWNIPSSLHKVILCKRGLGNEAGLLLHAEALHAGRVFHCNDVNPSTDSRWGWGEEAMNISSIIELLYVL